MKSFIKTYTTETGEAGMYIVLDEETKKNLNNIVTQTNSFLFIPLTKRQTQCLIESVVDFYFVHSDDVVEFKNFIEYISLFMELLANNVERKGFLWKLKKFISQPRIYPKC